MAGRCAGAIAQICWHDQRLPLASRTQTCTSMTATYESEHAFPNETSKNTKHSRAPATKNNPDCPAFGGGSESDRQAAGYLRRQYLGSETDTATDMIRTPHTSRLESVKNVAIVEQNESAPLPYNDWSLCSTPYASLVG